MSEIRWAEEALGDLERLQTFLLDAAPVVAEAALNRIERAVSSLSDFPRSGNFATRLRQNERFSPTLVVTVTSFVTGSRHRTIC